MLLPPPRSTLFPYTTLFRSPGVREDVTDILLNFKNLICRLHGESPEIEVRLSKKGAGAVKASDIEAPDRKSTRLNSSHMSISYAVFCLKKKRQSDGIP